MASRANTSKAITGTTGRIANRVTGNTPVPRVVRHAIDTFGSKEAASEWLSLECGALDNQSPADLIQSGRFAEVEHILNCIDYGMIA